MKRETITLMLNSLDDDYISEADVFCPESIQENPERIVHMKKRIITFALAAALMLALGITAYAIWSIHVARQQELKADLKIEESRRARLLNCQDRARGPSTGFQDGRR